MQAAQADGERVDAAIAIQISGHLHQPRRLPKVIIRGGSRIPTEETIPLVEERIRSEKDLECSYQAALKHVRACRQRFRVCDVFIHTWTNATTTTRSKHGGYHDSPVRHRMSSAACLRDMTRDLQPRDVWVEPQADPPPHDARGPDGQKWNESSVLWVRRFPDMHFGFTMNVRGMARAAELRRRSPERYDFSFRLRPDGRDPSFDFGWKQITSERLGESLWDCVAFAATGLKKHRRPGSTAAAQWAGAAQAQWHSLIAGAINACSPIGNLGTDGQNGNKRDNCFWATPTVMDEWLELFQSDYARVFNARNSSPTLHKHSMNMEHFFLKAASALKKEMPFFSPCYPVFMGGYNYSRGPSRPAEADEPKLLDHLRRGFAPPCLADAVRAGTPGRGCVSTL